MQFYQWHQLIVTYIGALAAIIGTLFMFLQWLRGGRIEAPTFEARRIDVKSEVPWEHISISARNAHHIPFRIVSVAVAGSRQGTIAETHKIDRVSKDQWNSAETARKVDLDIKVSPYGEPETMAQWGDTVIVQLLGHNLPASKTKLRVEWTWARQGARRQRVTLTLPERKAR